VLKNVAEMGTDLFSINAACTKNKSIPISADAPITGPAEWSNFCGIKERSDTTKYCAT